MVIHPNKAYAIIMTKEIEVLREYATLKDAERAWKDPRNAMNRGFATVTGAFLLTLLKNRPLKEKV